MADDTGGFAPVDTSGFVPLPSAPRKPPPAPASFIPTSAFRAQLPPGARDTGDYRTPGRERQLAAQGAGTVRPGATSRHSLGTEGAPGAHDIVPAGDWNADLARIRKTSGVKDAFIEGAQGGQGRHIHVDMADTGGFEAVDTGGFTPAPTIPVSPQATQPKPTAKPQQETNGFQRYLSGIPSRAVSGVTTAGHELAQDWRAATAPEKREEGGAGQLRDTPRLRAADRLEGDLWKVATSPVTAALRAAGNLDQQDAEFLTNIGASVIPLGKAAKGAELEHAGGLTETEASRTAADAYAAARADLQAAKTPAEKQAAQNRMRLAGSYIQPARGRPPQQASVSRRSSPPLIVNPRGKKVKPTVPEPVTGPGPGPVIGREPDAATRVDNALYRLGGHATAGKIEALQGVRKLPKEVRDPKAQEDLTHAIEARLTGGTPPPAPGMTRMYHGGAPDPYGKGHSLWFTSDLRDAKGWALRSPQMKIWYTDMPTDHPLIDPDWADQTIAKGHHVRRNLPAEFADKRQVFDETGEIPEHLQAAHEAVKPWLERQRVAANSIKERLAAKGLDELAKPYEADTGYVPRRVVGKSPGIDPLDQGERAGPLAWNQGKKSLARKTGSMFSRDQIALQFEDGTRRFEHRNPSNDEWKPGMTVRDPLTGKTAEVKPATIRETETAGARDRNGDPITYHKNALVNSIDEALKTERVDRNLQVLDELTTQMKAKGLAHQDEWHYKNDDGQYVQAKANTSRPDGFQELPSIPQLKGWSFSPEVANVLKDYYPGPDEPLDKIVSTVNRALNASLFITPFPHIKNVATMGFVGRGWDWLPTVGNYARLMRSGREAIKEVATLGPKYREFIREGAGMQAGDEATRNFYQQMLEAAAHGIASDPKAGAAMGFNPMEIGKALYDTSHKVLWNVNDMVMLQRYLELQAKGMSKRQAIAETEKWIANYRIPSQVMGQRWLSQAFKSGAGINFGRYTYGKFRAIGEMIKGLSTGSLEERTEAAGKVAALGVAGLILYPVMDQAAQFITGNKKAKVGRGGELGMVDAAMDPEKDQAAKLASVVTPAPGTEEFMEDLYNRDLYTGQHIREPQSTPLGQATQLGEHAADRFYPAQLGLDALKPGGPQQAAGRLVGVNLPPEGQDARRAKGKASSRKAALRRERKDPLEQLIKGLQ